MSISLFLCRIHVILKYMLRHNKEERFFPVMTGAFWLNVVLQSSTYFIYIQMPGYDDSISLNNETVKLTIVLLFFLSVMLFYLGIRKEKEYKQAEHWFWKKAKSKEGFY
ncbi:hypothetical protein [Pseudoalteromonas luteoviolacea]|uniref:hypothetical protein n=1 Tax=Pseudoalteromonas luteoviolacea TaxID=43657 RepID=UPI0011536A27|nr:hypothetical protein [Pseudoalteromonas luteoviolacea]TQF67817.1 hypothetical protein FLM44_21805 [Pseudoalteromonas luteoviolacea]